MKKTKLLQIDFSGGGVEVAVRLINENINPKIFDIKVIRNTKHSQYFNKDNKRISSEIIPVSREISLSDIVNIFKLYIAVKKYNPDIIHLHSAKAGVLGRVVAIFLGKRIFYTPHAFSFLSAPNRLKRKSFLIIEKMMRLFSPKAKIIACSKSEYYRAINTVGHSEQNVHLYNNSISPIVKNKLIIPQEFKISSNFLCTIGRPSYQKNLGSIIKIIKMLHEEGFKENLVILGVGHYSPELEKIKDIIAKYKLNQHVILFPWLDRNEALAILKKAKLYLSTSLYEGLPISIIEAMALGIPTIAFNVDGNRDLIKNNINGFLIDNKDEGDFKNKIIQLLEDDIIRKDFSKKCLNEYEEKFNITKNINIIENIYLSRL